MTVSEAVVQLKGTVIAGIGEGCEKTLSGCYVCDLLSYVIGRAKEDCAWITIMTNLNVIAVASLIGCACVILTEGNLLDNEAKAKADELGIPVISTKMTTFEAAKELAKEL